VILDPVDLDYRLAHWVQSVTGGTGASCAYAITWLGSGWMILPMVAFAVRGRHATLARALLLVSGITSGLVAILKWIVSRPRPFRAHSDILALVVGPSDNSCPSGHAAGSFAVAVFLIGALWPVTGADGTRKSTRALRREHFFAVLLVALAALIALSRVILGVHYPFDVGMGAILGAAIGAYSAMHWRRRRERRFSPIASR